ncbi:hypothetical protein BGX33_002406 [Mortierella sp. NVP41]|nr:hypothetical protein BGX33_002406 [Mortierella sp. NVP41]
MAYKRQYECTLVEQTETFLSTASTTGTTTTPHVLTVGTHRFAFSFTLHDRLPAVISSRTINIQYRITASLQQASFLPFSSPHVVSRPVLLLQRDELPSDELFETAVMRVATAKSDRLSGHISIPCSVIPQAGTIPLMVNLGLKGNASSVTKITIEMIERIFAIDDSNAEEEEEFLLQERLVTRQNCPIHDWSGSTTEESITIAKRLLFKIPQLPITFWTSPQAGAVTSLSSYRAGLEKSLCHASGDYRLGGSAGKDNKDVRIRHLIRFTFQIRGLSSSEVIETESVQKDANVWIVGNQEYREDESLPPSYYRSFSTTLVETDKIPEMDRRAMEALQDDLLPHLELLPPPCYEDCLALLRPSISNSSSGGSGSASASSSAMSSPTLASWPMMSRENVSHFSLSESLAESQASHDTAFTAYDLQAYTDRYSHANPVVFAT